MIGESEEVGIVGSDVFLQGWQLDTQNSRGFWLSVADWTIIVMICILCSLL